MKVIVETTPGRFCCVQKWEIITHISSGHRPGLYLSQLSEPYDLGFALRWSRLMYDDFRKIKANNSSVYLNIDGRYISEFNVLISDNDAAVLVPQCLHTPGQTMRQWLASFPARSYITNDMITAPSVPDIVDDLIDLDWNDGFDGDDRSWDNEPWDMDEEW